MNTILSLVFLFVAVAFVSADVKHLEREAGILRQSQAEPSADGNYRYDFETENKISVQEVGTRKEIAKGELGPEIVQGSASYETPSGQKIVLTYEADEYGFRPKGDHIPPVPIYIIRAIEYIKQQEELRARQPGKKF